MCQDLAAKCRDLASKCQDNNVPGFGNDVAGFEHDQGELHRLLTVPAGACSGFPDTAAPEISETP
jgi:hypothetical protein